MTESVPFAENYRKLWQSVIQYDGKARDYAVTKFKEPVKVLNGVRFFQKFEQIDQIATHGFRTKIQEDIIIE